MGSTCTGVSNIGKDTKIHYTASVVEVYYKQERIAMHKRNPPTGHYNTNPDHLSSTHKFYADWSPEFLKKKAKKHGENVLAYVGRILKSGNYPETGFKRALGVIQFGPMAPNGQTTPANEPWRVELTPFIMLEKTESNQDKMITTPEKL